MLHKLLKYNIMLLNCILKGVVSMLFTADAGNTNITLVVYKEKKVVFVARVNTDRRKTADQYAYDFAQIISHNNCKKDDFDGSIISSVVPEITSKLKFAIQHITGTEPLCLKLGVKTKLEINSVNRGELGSDLIAGAVAAKVKYPMPCLIWDLGTATKISVLDAKGKYLGCSISAGVNMCIECLGSDTSQLNPIEIKEYNEPFGNTSFAAISSGTIVGTAVMLEGLSARIKKKLGYENISVIATGGLAQIVLNSVEDKTVIYDENLINDGLRYIYEYNI